MRTYGLHDVGVLLAIFAGLFLVGLALFPVVAPQAREGSNLWLIGAVVIGTAFVAAPFLVGISTLAARVILLGGALTLAGSGLLFWQAFGGDRGLLALLVDVVPAIMAAVAAFLIGPIQRPTIDRH